MINTTVTRFISFFIITITVMTGFIYLFQNYRSASTKAQDNSLTLKIKLQGERYPQATTKTKIILYSPQGIMKEYTDVVFTYKSDNLFEGSVSFDQNFNYSSLYAVYIKPTNYFGQLFCSESVHAKDCKSPQFIFKQTANSVDLSKQIFFGGDISPANGKVDAYDISKIMAALGKNIDISTDINNDGMTNSMDYLLALYSLGNNISDDAVTLVFVPLTPTPTITASPSATLAPTVPVATSTPTLAVTPSPTVTPTITPSPTLTPSPTSTPSPTQAQTMGTCHLIPGPLAKSICGETEEDLPASTVYGECVSAQSTKPVCAGSSKAKCTCPTGKICSCQLKDTANQTVTCTNGGKIEIAKCN